MTPPRHRPGVWLALAGALLCAPAARAQQVAPAPADVACLQAQDIQPTHLHGLWQLSLWPEGGDENTPLSRGALLFEKHPDYPGSVRGELRRSAGGQDLLAQVSGDVTDGVFNLDESDNGVDMSAVWEGEPLDCGRGFRGTRRPAEGRPASEPVLSFRLRRLPGWQ